MAPLRLALACRRVEGLSGAVRLVLEEARAACIAGWSVDVYSEKMDVAAVRSVGATPKSVMRWPWGSWLKRRLFAALMERATFGYDIVHGHGDLLRQDFLSLHNCVHAAHEALTGRPLPASDAVGRLHAIQLSQRRFRILAANSRLMKDEIIRRFAVAPETIEVIYPGFDPTRFKADDRRLGVKRRAELEIDDRALVFGLLTSGDFEKRGLSTFLRAFAQVAREFPGARALVVGKEARPGPYLCLARELGIADRVDFRTPELDIERLFHVLDVYVHAARWEEFGMTILEAMACGVPSVVGAKTGAAELFSAEMREFVLTELSDGALSAAMLRLARDPDLRARLSVAGLNAAAPYTLAAHGRAVLALYERLQKSKMTEGNGLPPKDIGSKP